MGRGAEGGGGGETWVQTQRRRADRVLPLAPCALQVSAFDRILRELAQDGDGKSFEERVAQEVSKHTGNDAVGRLTARGWGLVPRSVGVWRQYERPGENYQR